MIIEALELPELVFPITCLLYTSRVVFVRVIAVGHKQHVADKRIQAVAYPDAVLIRFAGKVGL